jgi:hypothetical protein
MNAFTRDEILMIDSLAARSMGNTVGMELATMTAEIEYQSVICARHGEIVGYQALPTNPGRLVGDVNTEFGYLEAQINRGPNAAMLIVNVHADALLAGGKERSDLLSRFSRDAWGERELIVNILPGTASGNHSLCRAYELMQQAGVPLLLEDTQVRNSMDTSYAFTDARLFRINVSTLEARNRRDIPLECMLEKAREIGVQTILNGVVGKRHVEWAMRMGVDYVQGSMHKVIQSPGARRADLHAKIAVFGRAA